MFHDFLIILPEDEIINHLSPRSLETVVIAAFRTKLKFGFIRIVQENTITITAHKERNTLVERVLNGTITRLVTVPHLVGFAATVQLAGLFSQAEEVFVTTEGLVFQFALPVTDMPLIGIITEQQFLILVEYL